MNIALKNIIRRSLSRVKPFLLPIVETEAKLSAFWTRKSFKRLMLLQWAIPPYPESFDHRINLYYQWQETRNPLWMERGIFSGLCLHGGPVLELCCGEGFNTRNFYSLKTKEIIACDYDVNFIKFAQKNNSAENIKFVTADIITQMPEGHFDNVIWDASIEHFTGEEINKILDNIKSRLGAEGILSGYTVATAAGDNKLDHHKYNFADKRELYSILKPHFRNVVVFETIYPERHNLYFWASEGVLPFYPGWEKACVSSVEANCF